VFNAGPYVSTYRVQTLDGSVLPGVRCVKFANLVEEPETAGVSFVWYGEGVTSDGTYRHFGEAFQVSDGSEGLVVRGHASDLHGNGEQLSGYLGDLQFVVSPGDGGVPSRVVASHSGSREEWILEPDGRVESYTSSLPPIRCGGLRFREFGVGGVDPFPGQGVRLMLSSGSWLGAGSWFDKPYLHLGTFVGDPTADGMPVKFGTADICHEHGYCGMVEYGDLLIGPAPERGAGWFIAGGAWGEEWQPRHREGGWTLPQELSAITVLPDRTRPAAAALPARSAEDSAQQRRTDERARMLSERHHVEERG